MVVDASVVVKWLFPDDVREPNTAEALHLLADIRAGAWEVVQPPHWIAEAAAVATRLSPAVAREAVKLLPALELTVVATPEVYATAVDLASSLDHHLFDTLYHAVALEDGSAVLLTADERYFAKAHPRGRVSLLAEYSSLRGHT